MKSLLAAFVTRGVNSSTSTEASIDETTTLEQATTEDSITTESVTMAELTTVLLPCHTPRGVGNGLITSQGPYYPTDRVT